MRSFVCHYNSSVIHPDWTLFSTFISNGSTKTMETDPQRHSVSRPEMWYVGKIRNDVGLPLRRSAHVSAFCRSVFFLATETPIPISFVTYPSLGRRQPRVFKRTMGGRSKRRQSRSPFPNNIHRGQSASLHRLINDVHVQPLLKRIFFVDENRIRKREILQKMMMKMDEYIDLHGF